MSDYKYILNAFTGMLSPVLDKNLLDWQDSVKDKDLTAPPASPSEGDRYIVASVATGAWAGQEKNIADYSGGAWIFITPNEGYTLTVEDESLLYIYDGSSWSSIGSATDHGSLIGLGDDDHAQYHTEGRADTWLGNKDLDDIADGTDYGRVLNTELSSGKVVQLGTMTEDVDMGGFNIDDINVVNPKAISYTVYNNTGATLVAGISVYITGLSDGIITVAKCDNTDKDKMPCLGIVSVNIADSTSGKVVNHGIKSMNTSGFAGSVGDRLYVQSDGTIDTIEPTSGSVQRIGNLITKAVDGRIYIFVRGRKSIYSAIDEHPIIRMGNDTGHKKVSFHKYDDTEVGYIDEDGNFEIIGNYKETNDIFGTTGSGARGYVRIGDVGTTQHSLDSDDDLYVTGELEVKGVSFFDGKITAAGADLGANALTVNSIEIVGIDGQVNKAAIEDSDSWHSVNGDTDLDATFEATFVKKADVVNVLSDITSTGADIEDAVTKKHAQNTDTQLDSGVLEIDASDNLIFNQNSVAPFTSIHAGALANTLYLKEGKIGIGTTTPEAKLHIKTAEALVPTSNVHYDNLSAEIIQSAEGRLQFVANDDGNDAGYFILTSVPYSGDNKHWLIGHRGPERNNNFEIGYKTSYAGGNIASGSFMFLSMTTEGKIGIGTDSPGTLLQLAKDGDAYITLQNLTNEHTDGGAETKIIFKDHGNKALAQIQASHDGVVDDTKGDLILSTNTGAALTEALRINSSQESIFAGKIGIGLTPTANMAGLSIEAGLLTLKETTTPTADANYGKIYTKNDDKLYFQDGAGAEHEISLVT